MTEHGFSMETIQAVGFKGTFSLGLLNSRHVLIQFALEEDYLHCWLLGVCGLFRVSS